MALSTYDKQNLSPEDQERILNYKKAYAIASKAGDEAGKKAASEAAENVRKAYGYSGGDDGQQYIALPGHEGAAELQKADDNLVAAYSGINDAYKAQAEASKAEIEKQRAATLKQAYIGNMMDQKTIDQQMRASGITGGLSESARVAMQNNYRTDRNNIDTAAIEAKKDVDLSTQQAIAQNEVNRANAEYSAGVTNAQFQNTAATNNRNIKLTEEQTNLSKYTTFIQNGLVDSTNSKQIATALGVSESTITAAANAAKNGDAQAMALNLMSAGVYDDSFVELFGGHFSAETLQAYANQNRKVLNASISSKSSSSGSSSSGSDEPITIQEYALNSNYCEGYSESDYAQAAAQYGMSVESFKAVIEELKKNDDAYSPYKSPEWQNGTELAKAKEIAPLLEKQVADGWKDFVKDVKINEYGKNFTTADWEQVADELGVTVERAKELVESVKRIEGVK